MAKPRVGRSAAFCLFFCANACVASVADSDDAPGNTGSSAGTFNGGAGGTSNQDAGGTPSGGTSSTAGGAGTAPGDAGGSSSQDSGTDSDGRSDSAGNARRALVAVGYGGVRALSIDDGRSWRITGEDAPNGGDDKNLLRSVAYGKGLWVAGGWDRFYVSSTGDDWQRRPHTLGIIQGLAFGNDLFLASDIEGTIHRSDDGLAWRKVGRATTGKHTRLVFANGLFAASGGESGAVETSSDGVTWTLKSGLSRAAYCGGPDFQTFSACFGASDTGVWISNPTVYLRAIWKGVIQRSNDGRQWTRAFEYPTNAFDHFGAGFVP
jgi:hypothetical protein